MAKADVLTLVDDFSLSIADSDETTVLYDEVVRELGFAEVLTSTEVQTLVAKTEVLTFEDDTLRALEVHTGDVGRLDRTRTNSVRGVFGNSWRDLVGTTRAYVKDHEDEQSVRLVPKPAEALDVTVIRTDRRDDVPLWLELPVALEVLSREMSRESDHQDVTFSTAAARLSRLLFALLGIELSAMRGGERG